MKKTFEMHFSQIVRIIIEDLKEVIKLNEGDDGDSELVESCVRVLRHYMSVKEFDEWFEDQTVYPFPMERPH